MSAVRIRGARNNGLWWAVYTLPRGYNGLMLSKSGTSVCLSGGLGGRAALVGLTLPVLPRIPDRTFTTDKARRR